MTEEKKKRCSQFGDNGIYEQWAWFRVSCACKINVLVYMLYVVHVFCDLWFFYVYAICLCRITNPPAISLALIPFLVWYFVCSATLMIQWSWFFMHICAAAVAIVIIIVSAAAAAAAAAEWLLYELYCTQLLLFVLFFAVVVVVSFIGRCLFPLLPLRPSSVSFLSTFFVVVAVFVVRKWYQKFLSCFEVLNRVECTLFFSLSS